MSNFELLAQIIQSYSSDPVTILGIRIVVLSMIVKLLTGNQLHIFIKKCFYMAIKISNEFLESIKHPQPPELAKKITLYFGMFGGYFLSVYSLIWVVLITFLLGNLSPMVLSFKSLGLIGVFFVFLLTAMFFFAEAERNRLKIKTI